PGQGFYNLDDLRDHLDGHMEVQLEKKNQQPINQVFPPGIITCNNYEIPTSILERVQGVKKMVQSNRWDNHPMIVTQEIIYIACVIENLLPASPLVQSHITSQRHNWWRKHNMTCNCTEQVRGILFVYYYHGGGCRYCIGDCRCYYRGCCHFSSSSHSSSSSSSRCSSIRCRRGTRISFYSRNAWTIGRLPN
ncbi:MAG: hypothetical protein ACRYE7_02560, partial [Janthinobacterium lividum]